MNQKLNYQGVGMTSARTRQRLVKELRGLGINSEAVLAHIGEMPRHLFVDEALSSRAYENKSLPIGYGQTISQPYTVAKMTELLLQGECFKDGRDKSSVLEIGTGCGYQTLLLSHICDNVTSVERITPLHRSARDRLYDLGVRNVDYYLDDGFERQFKRVMPLLTNRQRNDQNLLVVDKLKSGIKKQILEKVAFVPRQSGIVK